MSCSHHLHNSHRHHPPFLLFILPTTPLHFHPTSTPLTKLRTSTLRCAITPPPPLIPPKILQAIETLTRRQARVTASDISTLSGISIPAAQNSLITLSSILHSGVDVTTDGTLTYRLGSNIRQRLRGLSTRYRVEEISEKVRKWGLWGVKRGFGVMLGLSIVITFAALFVVMSSAGSSSDGDDNGGRRGGGRGYGGGGMRLGVNLLDLFWYPRPYGYYYEGDFGRRRMGRGGSVKKEGGLGMLEAVYSCVFGDGDPNVGLEEERWRRVADVIRENGGAVVAEQIAGLLDLPEGWKAGGGGGKDGGDLVTHVDEDFMMEVARRFNGVPEVTDDGDLVYVFPDMVTTGGVGVGRNNNRRAQGLFDRFTSSSPAASPSSSLSTTVVKEPLREKKWGMSAASGIQKFLVGGLGLLNGVGVAVLGSVLGQVRETGGIVSLARGLYPILAIYAATYVAVPALRWAWIQGTNRGIDKRNRARELATAAVGRGDVTRKIREGKRYAMEHNVVKEKDVVFRSDREIGVGSDGIDEEDFDRRLEDANRSRSGS